jgi:hypothetical protein
LTPYYSCEECFAYFQSERQRDLHEERVHGGGDE